MAQLTRHGALLVCFVAVLLAGIATPSEASRLIEGSRRALRQLLDTAATVIDPAHFRSQVKQDEWVLGHHPAPGVFLDMGARDGESISNSYALEKHGWKGVCVEPFPTNFEGRKCKLAREVISNHTGDVVSFVMPDKNSVYGQGYGGIKDTISWEFIVDYNGTTFANVTTLGLKDFLVKYDIPKHIDYWSLDIEGAEFWALKEFPFCDYYVSLLTVEHNWQEPRRTQMRDLLEHHGFVNERQVEYDDWYRNTNPPPGAKGKLKSSTVGVAAGATGIPMDASTPHLVTAAKYLAFGCAGAALLALLQWVVTARKSKRARA